MALCTMAALATARKTVRYRGSTARLGTVGHSGGVIPEKHRKMRATPTKQTHLYGREASIIKLANVAMQCICISAETSTRNFEREYAIRIIPETSPKLRISSCIVIHFIMIDILYDTPISLYLLVLLMIFSNWVIY